MVSHVEQGTEGSNQLVIYPQGDAGSAGSKRLYKVRAGCSTNGWARPALPAATNVGVFWSRRSRYRRPGVAVLDSSIRSARPADQGFMKQLETVVETEVEPSDARGRLRLMPSNDPRRTRATRIMIRYRTIIQNRFTPIAILVNAMSQAGRSPAPATTGSVWLLEGFHRGRNPRSRGCASSPEPPPRSDETAEPLQRCSAPRGSGTAWRDVAARFRESVSQGATGSGRRGGQAEQPVEPRLNRNV